MSRLKISLYSDLLGLTNFSVTINRGGKEKPLRAKETLASASRSLCVIAYIEDEEEEKEK